MCSTPMHLITGVPRGGLGELNPHCLQICFGIVCLQALLVYSLNPKFSTGKRYKLYTNFTFFFSFWA